MDHKQIKLQETENRMNASTPTTNSLTSFVHLIDINKKTNLTNHSSSTGSHSASNQHHVTLDIPVSSNRNSKILVKRTTLSTDSSNEVKTFDTILNNISSSLPYNHSEFQQESINGWNAERVREIKSLSDSLKKESDEYHKLSLTTKHKFLGIEVLNLLFHSAIVFINTSAFDTVSIRYTNIALAVLSAFLNGIKNLIKPQKRAYQYAETSLALEGLSRTLRSQMFMSPEQRREPTELLTFIETTRDKVLKKLIEN